MRLLPDFSEQKILWFENSQYKKALPNSTAPYETKSQIARR